MCRVKARVIDGPIKAEKVAYIKTMSGQIAEVIVSSSQVKGNTVLVAEVGRDKGMVLVEFARETATGDWRAWVSSKQLVG